MRSRTALAGAVLVWWSAGVRAASNGPPSEAYAAAREVLGSLQSSLGSPQELAGAASRIGGLACDSETRLQVVAVYALALLAAGESEAAQAVVGRMRDRAPGSPILDWVRIEGLSLPCTVCQGVSRKECLRCESSGKCLRCGGKGAIRGGVIGGRETFPACPTCRGTGKCPHCQGAGGTVCRACGGKGQVVSRDAARAQFAARSDELGRRLDVLSDPSMAAVEDAIRRAGKAMDIPSAIAIVADAIAAHPGAGNVDQARAYVAQLEKDRVLARMSVDERKRQIDELRQHAQKRASESLIAPTLDALLLDMSKGNGFSVHWRNGRARPLPFTPCQWAVQGSSVVGNLARTTVSVQGSPSEPATNAVWTFFLEYREGAWKAFSVEP